MPFNDETCPFERSKVVKLRLVPDKSETVSWDMESETEKEGKPLTTTERNALKKDYIAFNPKTSGSGAFESRELPPKITYEEESGKLDVGNITLLEGGSVKKEIQPTRKRSDEYYAAFGRRQQEAFQKREQMRLLKVSKANSVNGNTVNVRGTPVNRAEIDLSAEAVEGEDKDTRLPNVLKAQTSKNRRSRPGKRVREAKKAAYLRRLADGVERAEEAEHESTDAMDIDDRDHNE